MSLYRVLVPCLAIALLFGCVSDRKPLGAQCIYNTDCDNPYVCLLNRCRSWCSGDRDCPLGAYCAADRDNQGIGSCLLPEIVPEETDCDSDRDCPSALRCASDRVCRTSCVDTDAWCLRSQECLGGVCIGTEVIAIPDASVQDGALLDSSVPMALDSDAATGACPLNFADCNGLAEDGCEAALLNDNLNCGMCRFECRDVPTGSVGSRCAQGTCETVCAVGFDNCDDSPDCETAVSNDESNCGRCGRSCDARSACIERACVGVVLPNEPDLSSLPILVIGEESGADAGGMSMDGSVGDAGTQKEVVRLRAGRLEVQSLHIGRNATVTLSHDLAELGGSTLEIYSAGDVIIEGTIDLSGADGGAAGVVGTGASGGVTGARIPTPAGRRCGDHSPGGGGSGSYGEQGIGAGAGCALGGTYGGGMSGAGTGGGGGGGYAGGGGGGSHAGERGGRGGSAGGSMGGAGGEPCRGGAGGVAPGPYAGRAGRDSDNTTCTGNPEMPGGGGGGSIGAVAAADLAVGESTFVAGSGGGGAGAVARTGTGGDGGGGGGGALRIVSGTRIVLSGTILAEGGAGRAIPLSGRVSGGGGSGGVVYLMAPSLEITGSGRISVEGGSNGSDWGRGGLGRIRFSTDPKSCVLNGVFGSVATRPGCTPSDTTSPTASEVYIGVYPN